MKIFELLSGDPQSMMQQQPDVAPMANAPSAMSMQPTQPMQQPQQQAGLWDMAKDFMSTPQPIGGGANPAAPTPPAPTPPGQPPAQSSGMISRPFGNTSIGQNLDSINKGLQPPK
jgi:hypothetical protein